MRGGVVVLVAGALVGFGALASTPAAAQEPPLNIAADNVTGSRGPEGDVVLLNGNVRITRARTVITAERGRYLRGQGMLFLDERVKLVDTTTTLTCEHAAYDENTDILQVTGNVVLRDRDVIVRAPQGTYDRRTGRAEFFGGVQAEDKTQKITAERLIYLRDTQMVFGRGRVVGADEKNRLVLRADSVDYDRRSKEAKAVGRPVLETRDEDGKITELRAITLRLNTETRVAEALDSVRVVRDTLQARADYGLFDDAANRGWLLGHPRAWDDETNVTGDTLEIWTEGRRPRRFVVRGNATIDYRGNQPSNRGETSRLTGERIDVHFTRDDIDSLVAVGRARNDYTAVPREGKTPEGNRAEGDSITVFFRDRKTDRALVRGDASGEYHFAVDAADTSAAKAEIVRYDAPRIEYIVPRHRIVLEPKAHLLYKELELRAKRVEFDSEKQTLVASGDPELVDRGDKVTGHLMTYDLESRAGTIYQAETAYEQGLYHGEQIRKVGDDILDVKNGSFSTCDLDPPHYHFQSNKMKIFLKDKLVARPVVFYIKNVPILALPFYLFPLKPGRHSGFLFPQFEFGFNNRAGQFLRNAGYYWAPNDYFDVTASGDYYQAEPSWVLRGETFYKLLYVLSGRIYGTYAHSDLTDRDDYSFQADHAHDLTPRTHLTGAGSFVSSRDFQRSPTSGSPISQRVQRFLNSNLTISHYADWAGINAFIDRREDLDADQSIRDPDGEGPLQGPPPGRTAAASLTSSLPSLSVSFPTRTIGSIGFLRGGPFEKALASMYLNFNARYLSFSTRNSFVQGYRYFTRDSTLDSTTVLGTQSLTRRGGASSFGLTDTRRLFGWINFAPSISADAAVFDHDNLGHEIVPTGTWSASVSTGTTLYGTTLPRWGPLLGIRHVVSPRASFSYSPEFEHLFFTDSLGIQRSRFSSFGGIGVSGSENSFLNFSLEQRLQVKLRQGANVQRLDNLVSLTTSGFYDFLHRKRGQDRGLSNLVSTLRVQPPGTFAADVNWTTDPFSQRPLRTLGYNLSLNLRGKQGEPASATPELPLEGGRRTRDEVDATEPWSIGLAYSYSGAPSDGDWQSSKSANAVLRYNLTPAWGLEYSASADVTARELTTQYFGLTRDLHCWTASFTRQFTIGGEAEYYFRLGIKDQKEIYIERGNRFGSLGGIQ